MKKKFSVYSLIAICILFLAGALIPGRKIDNEPPNLFFKNKKLISLSVINSRVDEQEAEDEIYIPFLKKNVCITKNITPYKAEFKNVREIFAVSDIHGKFNQFVRILKNGRIIDENFNWTFGRGHLVIAGDIMDRGSRVTECLWLIYYLMREAELNGGAVHFILGNHEIMEAEGKTKYIAPKYKRVAGKMNIKTKELYSGNSFFGRWLRALPGIIKINRYIFVHGGIHINIIHDFKSIDEINSAVYMKLNSSKKGKKTKELFGRNGIFWYRGYYRNFFTPEKKDVRKILSVFNAKKIITGHTTQKKIITKFKKQIICIDSGFKSGKRGQALFIRGNEFFTVDLNGTIKKLF